MHSLILCNNFFILPFGVHFRKKYNHVCSLRHEPFRVCEKLKTSPRYRNLTYILPEYFYLFFIRNISEVYMFLFISFNVRSLYYTERSLEALLCLVWTRDTFKFFEFISQTYPTSTLNKHNIETRANNIFIGSIGPYYTLCQPISAVCQRCCCSYFMWLPSCLGVIAFLI